MMHFVGHAVQVKDNVINTQRNFLKVSKSIGIDLFNQTKQFGFNGIESNDHRIHTSGNLFFNSVKSTVAPRAIISPPTV